MSQTNGRYKTVDDPDLQPTLIHPVAIGDLIDNYPDLRPVVVEGILRRGETANIIAAAKVGKSHLVHGLAWCIATGAPWQSHEVTQGRVLIIDNELHPETLANRLYRIATAMQIDYREYRDSLTVIPLRGQNIDIHAIEHRLATIQPGTYSLAIVDALYRTLPVGTSENDNAAMMAIYNRLDHYAATWDCAIAVVHHASKGAQGDKSLTDVGSGAGAISRAADTHLVIRPHEDPELSVLECVTRSFKSPEPVSIRYEWPLWEAVSTNPEVKKTKSPNGDRQAKNDQDADEAVSEALSDGKKLSVSQLRSKTGMGPDRLVRSLNRLGANGRACKSKKTGKLSERFLLPENVEKTTVVEWNG